MRLPRSAAPPRPAVLAAIVACLALAGCSGDVNPVRDLAFAAGVRGGEPKPAPDFVTRTRSPSADYIAVGTSAPPRPLRTKSTKEVSGAETELDQLKASNDTRAAPARAEPRPR